jgi:hypothetical protein
MKVKSVIEDNGVIRIAKFYETEMFKSTIKIARSIRN